MVVWVCHALGFCHHNVLERDPTPLADPAQAFQKQLSILYALFKGSPLVVVVQDSMEIPVAEIGVDLPAQSFLRRFLVDPFLLCGGVADIGAALHSFGVNPERLHFLVFDTRTSFHHPMNVGHGCLLFCCWSLC